jgi:hypothetical protein
MCREDGRIMFLQNTGTYLIILHGATSHKTVLIVITAITSNITLAEASHCVIIKYTYTSLVRTTVHPFPIFLLHSLISLQPKHVTGILEMQRRTVVPTIFVFNYTQESHNKTECFLSASNVIRYLKTDELL